MSIDLSSPPSARKFLFDRSFGEKAAAARQAERERPKPIYTQEQLDAAREEGRQEGYAAGHQARLQEQEAALAVLVSGIESALAKLMAESETLLKGHLVEARDLALAVVRRLLPTWTARHGLEEIDSVITRAVADMGREPRLVIRVAESQFDAVQARLKSITEQQAYAGKIVLLGEALLGPSDCRVEWADGGVERDMQALWQKIDELVAASNSAVDSSSSVSGDVSGERA